MEVEYTGRPITATVRLYDGTEIVSSTNYNVGYNNNTAVGDTAQVIITGKGKYTAETVTLNFRIKKKSIGDGTNLGSGIVVDESDVRNGGLVVRDQNRAPGDQILTEATDYNVKWGDGTLDGSAYNATSGAKTAVITGINNYEGSYTVSYGIGTDISDSDSISLEYSYLTNKNGLFNMVEKSHMTTKSVKTNNANGNPIFTTYYLGDDGRPKVALVTGTSGTYSAISASK